ncbi:MAG: carboxylesterase family protein [Saprospiraceae bacterium]|nr:carboxylesterase family protein [Saprospiraceae bacterium]
MKYFISIILLITIEHLFAQDCDYTIEKYGFRTEKKIFIGIEKDFQGMNDSLFVDIYYPTGSPEVKRPLVMWVFGGGFITGKREDFALVCESCAKRGMVAATIDYRIGFSGIQILPSDSAEVLRAGFRGIQDGKSALRYLKSRHLTDSIDLDRVWVGGGSAGAIVALGTAFYDKEEYKPAEAFSIGPVNGQTRPDLGSIEGNRYTNVGADTKVQGVFNIFGAVLNNKVFDQSDNIAVFSYHQTEDPVVPCGRKRPYWAYPIVTDFYPIAYGSCEIESSLTKLNFNPNYHKAWIYTGNQHAVHNEKEVIEYLIGNANPILCGTAKTTNLNDPLNSISIQPNPAEQQIYLINASESLSYKVLNIQGEILFQNIIDPGKAINIEYLYPGMYFLQLSKNKQVKTIRFSKIN